MKRYVLMFEYNSKNFMNINKIMNFKRNLEKVEKLYNVNMVFYGDTSNEELATFMGYFNNLIGKDICNFSISFKTKELVIENGINNKSIKLSAQISKEIKSKKFDSVINEYYSNDKELEIKVLPSKNWESLILDIIEE